MPNNPKPEWQKQLEDAFEHYDELVELDRKDEAHSFMTQFVEEAIQDARDMEAEGLIDR